MKQIKLHDSQGKEVILNIRYILSMTVDENGFTKITHPIAIHGGLAFSYFKESIKEIEHEIHITELMQYNTK